MAGKRKYGGSTIPYRKRARVASGPRRPYAVRKYVRIPARLRYSRSTFRRSSALTRALKTVTETKLRGFVELNEEASTPTQLGSQAYSWNGVTGVSAPTTWGGGWTPLEGFNYPQGAGNNQRVGRYMYLDHSTMRWRVDMNSSERLTMPTQFRMIIFKARRAVIPTGVSYDPDETLFLNEFGSPFGATQSGVIGNDLMMSPTNKRDWMILKDTKFTLQAPLRDGQTNSAAMGTKYPAYKEINCKLYHKYKAAFQASGGNDEPTDYDYHFGFVIYSNPIGRDGEAGSWEVNMRGTTCAQDS